MVSMEAILLNPTPSSVVVLGWQVTWRMGSGEHPMTPVASNHRPQRLHLWAAFTGCHRLVQWCPLFPWVNGHRLQYYRLLRSHSIVSSHALRRVTLLHYTLHSLLRFTVLILQWEPIQHKASMLETRLTHLYSNTRLIRCYPNAPLQNLVSIIIVLSLYNSIPCTSLVYLL